MGKTRKRVVLIGTYRGNQLSEWPGWYCWPLSNKADASCANADIRCKAGKIDSSGYTRNGNHKTNTPYGFEYVTELWLFRGTAAQKNYRCVFVGVMTRAELVRNYGYPATGTPHGDRYALFKTEPLYRLENGAVEEADAVIIRPRDFAKRSPQIARQLKVFLESDERTNPGLAKLLPSTVVQIPRKHLCVCEANGQMSLWNESPVADWTSQATKDGFGPIVNPIARKKRSLGQFFTEGDTWLHSQIVDFIKKSGASEVYDPFAGSGCLLRTIEKRIGGFTKYIGLDIDLSLPWKRNDSLVSIPERPDAIVVTNPPYLSNYSAARKKLDKSVLSYFEMTDYDDLYLLALDRLLAAQGNVVAIVPETFVNSSYRRKDRLHSITILQSNPFHDTDTPVVVACFDKKSKSFAEIKVYKDDNYVSTLKRVEDSRIRPAHTIQVNFNDPNGWLGVRCVDTTDPSDTLRFDYKENIDYDWTGGIKVSSRLLTLLSVDVPENVRPDFILSCNHILSSLRSASADVIFSPFKGNMKNGMRRRRLDFATCRAIVERAYAETMPVTGLFSTQPTLQEVTS